MGMAIPTKGIMEAVRRGLRTVLKHLTGKVNSDEEKV
jgi:hypothetical protein